MRNILLTPLFVSLAFVSVSGTAAVAQSTAVSTPYPIDAAVIRDRDKTHSYSVSSIDLAQQHHSLSWTQAPGEKTKFEGKPVYTVKTMFTSVVDKAMSYTANDTDYYSTITHVQLGTLVMFKGKHGEGSRYSVIVQTNPLPATATIGQSERFQEIIGYNNASKSKIFDRRFSVWSLEADPREHNGAMFCIAETIAPTVTPSVIQLAKECLHEDTAGNFSAPMEKDGALTTSL